MILAALCIISAVLVPATRGCRSYQLSWWRSQCSQSPIWRAPYTPCFPIALLQLSHFPASMPLVWRNVGDPNFPTYVFPMTPSHPQRPFFFQKAPIFMTPCRHLDQSRTNPHRTARNVWYISSFYLRGTLPTYVYFTSHIE